MGENTHSGHFSGSSTGRIEVLPVELRYWSFLAKSYRSDLKSYRSDLKSYRSDCYSVPNFDQFWYFSHNSLIYYPI